eukprot:TRINITY_DN235_c0_g1_i1.p1 TRINITY_DN235_c0_g1~~TRINITY_DN235_c0_g1_i1.p1  ORF type:complete len:169 (-),score=32.00 TRINITY_DN235_c0_g1_i1:163-669(-)
MGSFEMKKVILALLLIGCLAEEVLDWEYNEEVIGVPDFDPEVDLEGEPVDIPKPPNSPATACRRAKSKCNVYTPWACNQFINWCYFNNIRTGGLAKDYKTWPKVSNWGKAGTIMSGVSTAGFNHVAIVCGGILCHEPNTRRQPVTCRPANQLTRWLFRSYTLHYPPGY